MRTACSTGVRRTHPTWVAVPLPADGTRAAPSNAASCAPSREPAQTAGLPPAHSSCRRQQLAAPARIAPPCTPLRCSTKHISMGMFDGTSFPAVWFYPAQNARSHGVYWSIFTPARIRLDCSFEVASQFRKATHTWTPTDVPVFTHSCARALGLRGLDGRGRGSTALHVRTPEKDRQGGGLTGNTRDVNSQRKSGSSVQ